MIQTESRQLRIAAGGFEFEMLYVAQYPIVNI